MLGFAAGLLLDLAPPADHVAGRWALALVLVGYLAGRVRQDVRRQPRSPWSAPSRPRPSSAPRSSRSPGIAARRPGDVGARPARGRCWSPLVWDVLLTPFVLPLLMGLFRPPRSPVGDRREPGPTPAQPAAPGRDPGAGLLAVRHPLRPALLPPGRRRRGLPGPGRRPVGARDRRPAAARPDRRRPGPPAGGQPHLLGGLGRPHPARQARRSASATELVRRVAVAVETDPADVGGRSLVTCGDAGSVRRGVLERLALPAGPGRHRRPASDVALRMLEQPEDYPAVLAEQQSVRAYPRPFGINAAHVLGYLSPITEDEFDHAAERRRPLAQRRLRRRPRRRREAVRRVAARHARLPQVAVDSMGRVLGRRLARSRASPATPWSPRSTPRCRRVVEQQLAETHQTVRAAPSTP